MVSAVEGHGSKDLRKATYPDYKGSRSSRPPQAYEEFNKLKDMLVHTFLAFGSSAFTQDGIEADDVLAYFATTLEGENTILSEDGDLAVLVSDKIGQIRKGELVAANPYGPFPMKYITLYKSLVGDTSDNIKGAKGFGEKAWLDMCVVFGDDGLELMQGLIERRELGRLVEDVADFKPLQKIIDSEAMVYVSWDCAVLYPQHASKLKRIDVDVSKVIDDERLAFWKGSRRVRLDIIADKEEFPPIERKPHHAVFDIEIIGAECPVFLFCSEIIETGEKFSFWQQDVAAMGEHLARPDITFISFNGINFDAPVIGAALAGYPPEILKRIANLIIRDDMRAWDVEKDYSLKIPTFDHIDLCEVAPGVRITLKAYAGRMSYPTMVDMPFAHDVDLLPEQLPELERYCQNDLGVTAALFKALEVEIDLRRDMSNQYGLDLRSKSDAQVAEAVLRKILDITGKGKDKPNAVQYKTPAFIKTDSVAINSLIAKLESHAFTINKENGQLEAPDFLKQPLALGSGTYQCGVGGLHSTMDINRSVFADDMTLVSDFDVAGYYPVIIMNAGLVPRMEGNKGQDFLREYKAIYDRRIEAKRAGNKRVANTLKILLNGLFGKMGSIYSAFYAPDLLLAVTITGQLNLLCLIHELEKVTGVNVVSANTDGICIHYAPKDRDAVLAAIQANALMTGFEYEETSYSVIALKDVNNYLAITSDTNVVIVNNEGIKAFPQKGGKAKRKGLYASSDPKENPLYLMKNPGMQVCSDMVIEYLKSGVHPSESIKNYTDVKGFVAIRGVKGGGIQYDRYDTVDDWVLTKDVGSVNNEWMRQEWIDGAITNRQMVHSPSPGEEASHNWVVNQDNEMQLIPVNTGDVECPSTLRVVKRKSRPRPVKVGVGGTPFGRIARWYMTTQSMPSICYAGSGNQVPKTEGARVCMTLPDKLPEDINLDWYVNEALSILKDIGVDII